MDKKKALGQYYTHKNPFIYKPFIEWLSKIKYETVIEPFAGAGDIAKHLPEISFDMYDIDPQADNIQQWDTIAAFPGYYDLCITNPPYLRKSHKTNLYLDALKVCLEHCKYVCAIVPDNFIRLPDFKARCVGCISIPFNVFTDTHQPVCIALFNPQETHDFAVWTGDKFDGMYSKIAKLLPEPSKHIKPDLSGDILVKIIPDREGDIEFMDRWSNQDKKVLNDNNGKYRVFKTTCKPEVANRILEEVREASNEQVLNYSQFVYNNKIIKTLSNPVIKKILTKGETMETTEVIETNFDKWQREKNETSNPEPTPETTPEPTPEPVRAQEIDEVVLRITERKKRYLEAMGRDLRVLEARISKWTAVVKEIRAAFPVPGDGVGEGKNDGIKPVEIKTKLLPGHRYRYPASCLYKFPDGCSNTHRGPQSRFLCDEHRHISLAELAAYKSAWKNTSQNL